MFINFLTLALPLLASAVPLQKRIAQTIADSTTDWVAACEAAGGAGQCSTISVNAFTTLLAAAGPCDQQNAADTMVTLAKTLSNNADVIKFAQIFAQQPRNSVRPLSLSLLLPILPFISPHHKASNIARKLLRMPNLTVFSNANSKVMTPPFSSVASPSVVPVPSPSVILPLSPQLVLAPPIPQVLSLMALN
jgi:hypothetical protein